MTLLTHFVRTDVRQFRASIALWVVVAVASAVLEAVTPALADPVRAQREMGIALAAGLLRLADLLLAFALVATVIQAHPLVGSTAFWMTRPVPWRTLLSSKLVLLWPLLVGVPIACDVVYMVVDGVPAARIAAGGLQMALVRTLGLTVVMAAAAVTPNVARFAVVCAGALLLAAVAAAAVGLAVQNRDYVLADVRFALESETAVRFLDGPAVASDSTSSVAGILLGIGAAMALVVVQYRARSRRRSVPLGVIGGLLAIAAAWTWPWPVLAARPPASAWLEATQAIRLSADEAVVRFEVAQYGRDPVPSMLGWSRLRVHGVPPGLMAAAWLRRASVDHPGGQFASASHAIPRVVPFGDRHLNQPPLQSTIRDVLGVSRYGGDRGVVDPQAVLFRSSPGEFQEHAGISGAYRGEFVLELTRVEVAAVVPLRSYASFRDWGYRISFQDVSHSDGRVRIRTRLSAISTFFDRTPRPTYSFYLRNSRRGEASDGHPFRQRDLLPFSPQSSTSGFSVDGGDLVFGTSYKASDGGVLYLDDAWLADAELVILRTTYAGRVRRTLELPDVTLTPSGRN